MGIWCFLFFWSYTAIVFMFHSVSEDTDLGGNAEAFLYRAIPELKSGSEANLQKDSAKGIYVHICR